MDNMTPRRPYMLRAFYDWLVDNDLTPHIVVEADLPGVRVPEQFVENGQIVLNVAPRAVGNLELGIDTITFSARFSGKPHSVIVPLYAVQAIYARENGAGTMFEPEEAYSASMEQLESIEQESTANIALVDEDTGSESSLESSSSDVNSKPLSSKPKGKPSLRVIK